MSEVLVERVPSRRVERWRVIRKAITCAIVLSELNDEGDYATDGTGIPYAEYNPWDFEQYMELHDQPELELSEIKRYARLLSNLRKSFVAKTIQPQLPMEIIGGHDDK